MKWLILKFFGGGFFFLPKKGFSGGSAGKKSACNVGDLGSYLGSFLGWEDLLEKGTATHSSVLAWKIPWTV